ncbi:hypothetical protein BGZ61DRAFT_450768 [Ilyonectria robusta]|uniref:uncharacterized protein n=1 Tax=Ilyonectria robusta TaxID=1079257 RepID=UPI001E8E1AF4|nr:uncharacterized protein BGZ61DRAFT_450768 [Ilyonectria robusta]KAH8699501.1 hypothetical protein BGZ61DRAFT_450768 [Ilyonectria robusta]
MEQLVARLRFTGLCDCPLSTHPRRSLPAHHPPPDNQPAGSASCFPLAPSTSEIPR